MKTVGAAECAPPGSTGTRDGKNMKALMEFATKPAVRVGLIVAAVILNLGFFLPKVPGAQLSAGIPHADKIVHVAIFFDLCGVGAEQTPRLVDDCHHCGHVCVGYYGGNHPGCYSRAGGGPVGCDRGLPWYRDCGSGWLVGLLPVTCPWGRNFRIPLATTALPLLQLWTYERKKEEECCS